MTFPRRTGLSSRRFLRHLHSEFSQFNFMKVARIGQIFDDFPVPVTRLEIHTAVDLRRVLPKAFLHHAHAFMERFPVVHIELPQALDTIRNG